MASAIENWRFLQLALMSNLIAIFLESTARYWKKYPAGRGVSLLVLYMSLSVYIMTNPMDCCNSSWNQTVQRNAGCRSHFHRHHHHNKSTLRSPQGVLFESPMRFRLPRVFAYLQKRRPLFSYAEKRETEEEEFRSDSPIIMCCNVWQ